MTYKKLKFLLPLIVIHAVAIAQTWQDTTAMLDKIVSRYGDSIPSGQLAISRNGTVIYSVARGMANLEYSVPLRKDSKIEAGSVSKQFIAACILLLEQQGKLLLSDDIRKYIPELPDYGYPIKIEQLMHHTSGLRDWIPLQYLAGWLSWTRVIDNNDIIDVVSRQKTLNNKPGDEFIYSNSNYCLLATIIERTSKMTVNTFSTKFIFVPAGMEHTEWRHDYKTIVPGRATAYSKKGNTYFTDMPTENVYGHAGLLTTAEDLLRWNNYYFSGKLGSPSLLPKQIAISRLNNGKINAYGAGLRIDSINGYSCINHRGLTAGYRASIEYFPQLGLSIAWISNNSQSDLSNMQPGVFNIPSAVQNLLVRNIAATFVIKTDSTLAPATFASFMGAYRDNNTAQGFQLAIKGNDIYNTTSSIILKPVNGRTLAMGQQLLVFTSVSPRKAALISPAGDTTSYLGTDTALINEKDGRQYSGTYYSDELNSTVVISGRDNRLMIWFTPHIETVLIPVYKDGFRFRIEFGSVAPSFSMYFERDTKNNITGFIVNEQRIKKIRFSRKK